MSATDTEPNTRRWTTGRILATAVVVGLVSMWVYVIYLAFGPGRADPPDRLDDPQFAETAEVRCSAALDAIAQLPTAVQSESAEERADVVADANAVLADMLEDLERLAPAGEDGRLVGAWLVDWQTYLRDREEFAVALRTDPEARMLISARDREQITQYLDAFAADNHMPACGTPPDV